VCEGICFFSEDVLFSASLPATIADYPSYYLAP
jgi:hypothetical protein